MTVLLHGTSRVASTRKLRKELTYELAKLRRLQHFADGILDEVSAKAFARQIREQADICLALLDKYEGSAPGQEWSYAQRKCEPIRQDLTRTKRQALAASGEWWKRPTGPDASDVELPWSPTE